MLTIHKYTLIPSTKLDTHRGAELLSVTMQGLEVVAYFRVNTDMPLTWRRLEAYGTGRSINPKHASAKFAGTVQRPDGMVFHIFDLGEDHAN